MIFRVINDMPIDGIFSIQKGLFIEIRDWYIDMVYKRSHVFENGGVEFKVLPILNINMPKILTNYYGSWDINDVSQTMDYVKNHTIRLKVDQSFFDNYLIEDTPPMSDYKLMLKKMATYGNVVLGEKDYTNELKWPYKKNK